MNMALPAKRKTERLYSGENRASLSVKVSYIIGADRRYGAFFAVPGGHRTNRPPSSCARSPYTMGLLAPLSRPSTYGHDPKFPIGALSRTSVQDHGPLVTSWLYPPFFGLIFLSVQRLTPCGSLDLYYRDSYS